jgi:fructose-bisphosphate aldolase, class II
MRNLKHYFKKAYKEGWAIPQFNFSTAEQVRGIVNAAKNLKSPIILGTSEGESKFFGLKEAVALRDVIKKETGLPIFLNLDHGKNFEYVKQAINVGYDMVHFDGSKLPIEENIRITKQLKRCLWFKGILLEGEIGIIGNDASKLYAEKFEVKEENLTNPEDAKRYTKETNVDLLAISIGNFHGIGQGGADPNLRFDVLENIKKVLKKKSLVLHGGSGIPGEDIKKAIKLGIVKININTELRQDFTESLKKSLAESPQEITPYKYFSEAIESVRNTAEEKIKLFGSENKA